MLRNELNEGDIVFIEINKEEFRECLESAANIKLSDRNDLHERDPFERFINVLMGEIAEKMVMKWFAKNEIKFKPAHDKTLNVPDGGRDIIVYNKGREIICSVKSSLSYKLSFSRIIEICKLATKKSELRSINIQVYFRLVLEPPINENRYTVPNIKNSAIIGWFGEKDLEDFTSYSTEKRQVPLASLRKSRTMLSLLEFLDKDADNENPV